MKKYFNILDIIGQKVMKKKVCELTYTFTTYMCMPTMNFEAYDLFTNSST